MPDPMSYDSHVNTLFISDLHLDPKREGITRIFLNFLQTQAAQADALYILGDFFEVWIGDDEQTPFQQEIITAINNLTQKGIPVYFMVGNRDFCIGKKFLQDTGCQWLNDPSVINLYGEPVLLLHGDLLCTDDKWYQRYRCFVRNPFIKGLFLRAPLVLRSYVANKLRQQSKHDSPMKASPIYDASFSEITRVMHQYNVKLLIHGHTHRPSIEYFSLDSQQTACRIVLSDWSEKTGNVLVCTPDGEKRLNSLI